MRVTVACAALGAAAALCLASAAGAQTSVGGLSFIAPTAGATLTPGGTIALQWTGGQTGWKLNLDIRDAKTHAVVKGSADNGEVNTGELDSFPVPKGLTCGKTYQLYIERTTKKAYAYSAPLAVAGCH